MLVLLVFAPILLVGFVFACRQDRVNRAMAEMQDSGADTQAGYVGPHLPGPF